MKRLPAYLLVVILAQYVIVYACLSANGQYEPAVWGVDHVKWYSWAPQGYMRNGEWTTGWAAAPRIIFQPLYYLDVRFWHPHRHA